MCQKREWHKTYFKMDIQTLHYVEILGKLLKLFVKFMKIVDIINKNKLKKLGNINIKKTKRPRSCCVKKVNLDRREKGFFTTTFIKIKELNNEQFFLHTRMQPEAFTKLLNLVKPHLTKKSIRKPIDPECRLAVSLLYLSQGTATQSLAESFKLGKETVRSVILETTKIIWEILSPIYVSEPNIEDLKKIAEDYWEIWNMPNCIGSIDGKHIALRCPPNRNSDSQYACYKKYFSTVLMAVCDAKYRFTYVDVGAYGSQSEAIFEASRLGKRLKNNQIPVPSSKSLPKTNTIVPHYFIGGVAFPLGNNLMRPYPGNQLEKNKEIFNKRLFRANRTIENAFGLLISRWRVLSTTLYMLPENAEKVVLACIALHNFIIIDKGNLQKYCPHNFTDWENNEGVTQDGLWRKEIKEDIPSIVPSCNLHRCGDSSSKQIRNNISKFLNSN